MATEFVMPKLGLTMEEGTILQWLVEDGATIAPGTPVMLIETDKVESEVEASSGGRLHRTAEAGATFRCGEVIGWLLAEGEAPPVADTPVARPAATPAAVSPVAATPGARATDAVPASTGGRRFVSPNARRLAAERDIDLTTVRGTGPGGRIVSEDLAHATTRVTSGPGPIRATAPIPTAGANHDGSVPATVAARQLADLLGVDLALVEPDPIDRYVTRESVAQYVRERLRSSDARAGAVVAAAAPSAAQLPPASQPPTSVKRLSGMRGTIAKRMHASLSEMAQLTLTMDADVDAIVADRAARRGSAVVPSYTDYVMAAVARALRAHPVVNSQITDEGIAFLPDVHVGLAVALDDGLLVPVVRHTDRLRLADLAESTGTLAAAARAGRLTLQELEGGTFSVSALGSFGVETFTPVINPPNAAILGVGRVRDELVMTEAGVAVTKRMMLSLTWDHRVFDGAPAALFCKTVVDLLAEPRLLD
jgi:pyruvate dehydrogenase E2 component (dihydrolipoamide acetyltransferase)